MGRFVAGLVLGAVLGGVACYAYFAPEEHHSFPAAAAVEIPVLRPGVSESVGDSPLLEDAGSSPDPSTDELEASARNSDPREVQLQRLIAESSAADLGLRSELQALRTARFREEQPIVLPLPLPPEFDWLSRTSYINPHDEIQREHRDAVWASAVEAEIRDYVGGNPELFRTFGYPTIECRTSRCAVTFALHGVDEDVAAINRRFNAITSDFPEREWAEHFPDTSALYADQQGGVHTIYWALTDLGRAMEVRRSQGRD
jgi:hypothetical protein